MRLADDMESAAVEAKMAAVNKLREMGHDTNPDDLVAIPMSFSPEGDVDAPLVGEVIPNINGCDLRIVEVDWMWAPIMQMEYQEHGTVQGIKADEDGFARREDGMVRVCRSHSENPLVAWVVWCEKV